MTLDDFFGDTEAAWKRKLEREEAARKAAEADERRKRIEEPKKRKGRKGSNPLPDPAPAAGTSVIATSLADYIKLENLECKDADGNIFERYDTLYVKKDVEKDAAGKIKMFTPYQAIRHCEQSGFLPSAALMANIHVAIYHAAVERQPNGIYRTKNPEMEELLKKLQDRGDGVGGHWTNTLVDWKSQIIAHYPQKSDFPNHGGTAPINAGRRVARHFDCANFADMELEEALKIPNYRQFVQNYSGLPNPEVLIEVAKYHGKTARVWISSSQETRAAWFGCNRGGFGLGSNGNLINSYAARGVRERAP